MSLTKRGLNGTLSSLECAVVTPGRNESEHLAIPLDRLYDDIIKPGCELAGLFPYRTESSFPFSHAAVQSFIETPVAVCILGPTAPHTHFLLGSRIGAGRPTVLVQPTGQTSVYDIPEISVVEFRDAFRYREVVEDQQALASALVQAKNGAFNKPRNVVADETTGGVAVFEAEEFDTKRMLQLIHYQLNTLQAEMQLALKADDFVKQAEFRAELAAIPLDSDAPPLEQGEMSYLHARKLYADGAPHKEIFNTLKLARNKLVDALKMAQESGTSNRIQELLRKTTEFEKHLLG